MTTTTTSGAADLLDLIEAYAEARHRQDHSSYNAQTAQAAAPIKTLTEAIAHAEDKAKGNSACAMEHAKLAAWLTELQLLRAGYAAARLEIESLKAQLHAAKQINAAQFGLLAASVPGSALRATHGQAPAQPDPAYSEACNLATALFKNTSHTYQISQVVRPCGACVTRRRE